VLVFCWERKEIQHPIRSLLEFLLWYVTTTNCEILRVFVKGVVRVIRLNQRKDLIVAEMKTVKPKMNLAKAWKET
jgi:hypothetical protein